MRLLVGLMLTLILSVWLGIILINHPGYVLLVYQPWMVQFPIWFAALCLLFLFALLYFVMDGLNRWHLTWFRLKAWWQHRKEQKAMTESQRGLAALIEGDYVHAERYLLSSVGSASEPLMHYLGAAQAAEKLGRDEKAKAYYQEAHRIAPKANLAIGIMEAKYLLQRNDTDEAIQRLEQLRATAAYHPAVLTLLRQAYLKERNWEQVIQLLPVLYRASLVTKVERAVLEIDWNCHCLKDAARLGRKELDLFFNSLGRSLQNNATVLFTYLSEAKRFQSDQTELQQHQFDEDASQRIRKVLKYTWHEGLVLFYGECHFDDLNRPLVVLGAWLKQYGDHPALFLVLGQLCVRLKLWGRAKSYYEKCLSLGPNAGASMALGRLLESLGELDGALSAYRGGLEKI